MTERVPWWKAFLPKRKGGSTKDTQGSTPAFGPDFDPFAPRAEKTRDHAAAGARKAGDQTQDQSQNQTESNKKAAAWSDDTYDDSQLESMFNEKTCRRNMNVSRSGRYREKRRVRSTLPIEDRETENVASGREDRR